MIPASTTPGSRVLPPQVHPTRAEVPSACPRVRFRTSVSTPSRASRSWQGPARAPVLCGESFTPSPSELRSGRRGACWPADLVHRRRNPVSIGVPCLCPFPLWITRIQIWVACIRGSVQGGEPRRQRARPERAPCRSFKLAVFPFSGVTRSIRAGAVVTRSVQRHPNFQLDVTLLDTLDTQHSTAPGRSLRSPAARPTPHLSSPSGRTLRGLTFCDRSRIHSSYSYEGGFACHKLLGRGRCVPGTGASRTWTVRAKQEATGRRLAMALYPNATGAARWPCVEWFRRREPSLPSPAEELWGCATRTSSAS
ncbi:hypothetical protein BD309DRAFT_963648 [Dichomitus squalens]|uniref:Uncharacterized protein n=1 Tax=Dichomitus squalens TaxID=114155 RepID=A0A4Q9PI84_9APHY|nr:hypothetical protein BD309DRAFT_963648 [Dichomitus squalens]TBU52966.1 hypothetical protein BD310DRAFT_186139 [Dichomitus squalens]